MLLLLQMLTFENSLFVWHCKQCIRLNVYRALHSQFCFDAFCSFYFIAHLVPALKLFRTKFLSGFIICFLFPPRFSTKVHRIVSYDELKNKSEKFLSSCTEYRIRLRTNWILKSINLKIVCNRFTFIDILKHLARLECCLRCENERAALYPKMESQWKAIATEA